MSPQSAANSQRLPGATAKHHRARPRRAVRSFRMAGNGTCATFWMGIDYVPICPSHSGSDWLRTNYMCTSRRAGSLRAGPGRERGYGEKGWWRPFPNSHPNYAPFSGETGRNRGLRQRPRDSEKEARLGCETRSAHMFHLSPKGGLSRASDWHIVRFSPARSDRGLKEGKPPSQGSPPLLLHALSNASNPPTLGTKKERKGNSLALLVPLIAWQSRCGTYGCFLTDHHGRTGTGLVISPTGPR